MTPSVPMLTRRAALLATAGALIAATLVTAGCAAFKTETSEQIVARRAQERWQALIKRDFATGYTYLQPGYRAVVSEKSYASSFGTAGAWKAADIQQTTCEAERCTVRLKLTTQNLSPQFSRSIPEITGIIEETWVKDQGQWWIYQAI